MHAVKSFMYIVRPYQKFMQATLNVESIAAEHELQNGEAGGSARAAARSSA